MQKKKEMNKVILQGPWLKTSFQTIWLKRITSFTRRSEGMLLVVQDSPYDHQQTQYDVLS